jgi:hypothetical protein
MPKIVIPNERGRCPVGQHAFAASVENVVFHPHVTTTVFKKNPIAIGLVWEPRNIVDITTAHFTLDAGPKNDILILAAIERYILEPAPVCPGKLNA